MRQVVIDRAYSILHYYMKISKTRCWSFGPFLQTGSYIFTFSYQENFQTYVPSINDHRPCVNRDVNAQIISLKSCTNPGKSKITSSLILIRKIFFFLRPYGSFQFSKWIANFKTFRKKAKVKQKSISNSLK